MSGAGRSLLDILAALPAEVEPVLLAPPGQLSDVARELGVPVLPFRGTDASFKITPALAARAVLDVGRSVLEIRSAARATTSDLVHANSIRAGLMAVLARRLGTPPVVVHLHDVLPAGRGATLVRRLLHHADVNIAVSQHVADNIDPRSSVMFNPLDVARFGSVVSKAQARTRLAVDHDRPLLALVAQITPWKGQATAIEALPAIRERHPGTELLLVGEPKFVAKATRYDNVTYARSLREAATRLGVGDAVRFMGERDDVEVVMSAADVVLVPSWDEPFGRTVIEAMAAGTPVVATTVGGPAEVVEDGVTGLLAPPRDPAAWAARTSELLADGERRRAMGEAGRRAAVRYDRDRYAAALVELYRNVHR